MIDQFDTVLRKEVGKMTGLPTLEYSGIVIAGGVSIKPLGVVSVTRRNNYIEDMFEEVMVTALFTPSDYTEALLPAHSDLVFKLTESPKSGGTSFTMTYKAVLTEVKDEKLEGNIPDVGEPGVHDDMSMSVVTFQLVEQSAYDLLMREVGDIYDESTAIDVLAYNLNRLKLQSIYDAKSYVAKINCDPEPSEKVFDNIKIPEGTELAELPDYLQDKYGLFSHGMGCFLKNQCWFVFEPYGLKKHDMDVRKLIVFNAPASKYSRLERTFRTVGKNLNIVTTGNTEHLSGEDKDALNKGVGVRYGSLRAVSEGMSTKDPAADPKMKPNEYMTDYRNGDYKNPMQRVNTAKSRLTDNHWAMSSELSKRGGEVTRVIWEGGTIDPLVPGMPVLFHYGKHGKVETRKGTLLSAEELSSNSQNALAEQEFEKTCVLNIWLKR